MPKTREPEEPDLDAQLVELAESQSDQGDPETLQSTEAQLREAEDALAEADSLADALEQRVLSGDDTATANDLAARNDMTRFARLRKQFLEGKVQRAREATHTVKCREVADEARDHADTSVPDLVAALSALQDAGRHVMALTDQHNQRHAALLEKARELTPEHTGPGSEIRGPSPRHARLGWTGANAVVLDRRQILPIDPRVWLGAALAQVSPELVGLEVYPRRDGKDVLEQLSKVHDEKPAPPEFKYFRGTNGMVIGMNRALSDNERRNLTPLTDAETVAHLAGGAA